MLYIYLKLDSCAVKVIKLCKLWNYIFVVVVNCVPMMRNYSFIKITCGTCNICYLRLLLLCRKTRERIPGQSLGEHLILHMVITG